MSELGYWFTTHHTVSLLISATLIFIASFWSFLLLSHLGIAGLLHLLKIRQQRLAQAKPTTLWPQLSTVAPSPVEQWCGWAGLYAYTKPTRLQKRLALGLCLVMILLTILLGRWVLIFCLSIFLLGLYILSRRARQTKQLAASQLPDALQSLSDTLHSGFSLSQAIIFVARELESPLKQVFDALVRAEALNIDFPDSLRRIALQLNLPEWTTLTETLGAQQKIGGTIMPLLQETIKTLQNKLHVEAEITTLTAAGRMSGFMIGGLVPLILIFFFVLSPSYISVLFSTAIGRIFFTLAIILEIIGFLWIKKIISIKY